MFVCGRRPTIPTRQPCKTVILRLSFLTDDFPWLDKVFTTITITTITSLSLFRHCNFVTPRPRNNIFALLPLSCLREKTESDRAALLCQRGPWKEKKEIVLTRIGLTNMALASNGLNISSKSWRKNRIWRRRRWFPQTMSSFYQRLCKAVMTTTR